MSKLTANLLLLFAAALWGFGNVAQKTVLTRLDALSAVGLRCLIGGLLVLPFVLTERRLPAATGHVFSLVRVSAASHAAVIVSAESVFGAVGAAIFLGERNSPAGALGAAIILGAVLSVAMSNRTLPARAPLPVV